MSIPNLGLTEKQLSFLAFFKETKQEIFSPRAEVFNRQKQQLTQCAKLIEQLNQAWDALKNESESFKTQFPSFTEGKLSQIILHVENWCNTKQTLDQTVGECSKVYVPSDILSGSNLLTSKKKNVDAYLFSAKQYIELCSIEREITEQYHAKQRNYQKIANIIERYQKLSLEIRNFIKSEPQRMLLELTDKLEILNRFNKNMKELGVRYDQLTNPVRTGTLVFKYGALSAIKKDLGLVPDWLGSFKKLATWVDTLSEDNQSMLVGTNRVTDSRGEYQTYTTAAAKMQELLDESKHFYKGAEVCAMIEALAKNTFRKKHDVSKVQNAYKGLSPAASKYVDAKLLTLLNSMADSSDMLSQVEEMISMLEATYHKLTSDVKSGTPAYSYEKFATVQTALQKARDWMGNYDGMTATLKMLQNKVELTPAIQQKINTLAANAVKVNVAANELPTIEKAYEFESALVKDHVSLDSEEGMILDYKKKLDRLSSDVKAYISAKWKDMLTKATTFHSELRQLKTRVEALLKEYAAAEAKLKAPSYETYYLYAEADEKAQKLAAKYKDLTNDITAFKTKYAYPGDFSATEFRRYVDSFKKYSATAAKLQDCYDLYRWAQVYNSNPNKYKYETSTLRQMLRAFESNKSRYLEFDRQNLMATVFESVYREIQQREIAEAARRKAARRKEMGRRAAVIIIALLSVVAMVYLAMTSLNYMIGGSYWLWLIISAAIGVLSVFLLHKAFDSKAINIIASIIYGVFLLGVSVPMHFWAEGSRIWYVSFFAIIVLVVAVINIVVDESTVVIGSIYFGGIGLFVVGYLVYRVYQSFTGMPFIDNFILGLIPNIFIALWGLIVGVFSTIFELLGYIIGGGYWMSGAGPREVIINTILYSLVAGVIITGIIGAVKDELD